MNARLGETPRQNVRDQQLLDKAAARESIAIVQSAIQQLPRVDENRPAARTLSQARVKMQDILSDLLTAGAEVAAYQEEKGDPLNLAFLSALADPETEELLFHLEQAQAVAERIDARRGRTIGNDIPLSPGESWGTDLAETISEIALRVRGEVHGPQGRD